MNVNILRQYFKQGQTQYLQRDNIDDVLLTLDDFFKFYPNLERQFGESFGEDSIKGAYYGVLTSGVCFGYNFNTGKMALFTSDENTLIGLANKGILVGKKEPISIELPKLLDKLRKGIRASSEDVQLLEHHGHM